MQNALAASHEEPNLYSSSLLPGPAQKRFAFCIIAVLLLVVFLISWPFAGIHTGPVAAFVPAWATSMFVTDGITAILLFAQFSVLRLRALLAIASGYLFTALIIIPFLLGFPGLLLHGGVLGGISTTSAIYMFWHAGFAAFVIGYALLKDLDPSKRYWRGSVASGIFFSVTMTAALVAAIGILCLGYEPLLPRIAIDRYTYSPLWVNYVGAPILIMCVIAITALWIRRRSMLDLWLMVVVCLFAVEVPLSYYPHPTRFSSGWYAVRVIGTISSGLILVMLLYEILTIYRLIGVQAQRRERESRLMTGGAVAATIAHEVKQPLSAMIASADAGASFLNRASPDFDEAKEAFKQIVADGHRAGAVIGGIQTIFKKETRSRTSFELNTLIHETLGLLRDDFKAHGISVNIELLDGLPHVTSDRIQLQQVLVNLITNAVESMTTASGTRILLVKSEIENDKRVIVSVADSGVGISSRDIETIFNPFFTTKPHGMGMGLSICRSFIEAHNGRLWVGPNIPRGSVFYFSAARTPSPDEVL